MNTKKKVALTGAGIALLLGIAILLPDNSVPLLNCGDECYELGIIKNSVSLQERTEVVLRNRSIDVAVFVPNCTWVPQNLTYNSCSTVRQEVIFYNEIVRSWQELRSKKKVVSITDVGYYCWQNLTSIACVSLYDGAGNIKAKVIKKGMTFFVIDNVRGKVYGEGFSTEDVKKELKVLK